MFLACALLASPASAARDGSADVVRDLAVHVGPIVGGALACREVVRSRLQIMVDKLHTVIRDTAGNEAGHADIAQVSGGVDGRMFKQIADGDYGPARALAAIKQLCERDQVFGYVGNGGSTLNFERGEHQPSHKIWGTALDEAGIFQPIDLE